MRFLTKLIRILKHRKSKLIRFFNHRKFDKKRMYFDNNEQEESYRNTVTEKLNLMVANGEILVHIAKGFDFFVNFALETGTRCKAILNIKKGWITFNYLVQDITKIKVFEKGGESWDKLISPRTTQKLKNFLQINGEEYLFSKNLFTFKVINKLFDEVNWAWYAKVKVIKGNPNVHTYCPVKIRADFFRHNLAVKALRNGIDSGMVCKLGGWKDTRAFAREYDELDVIENFKKLSGEA